MSEASSLIDRELKRLLPGDRSALSRAMRYSVFAGGKRFRPVLVLESAKACGGSPKDALAAACAVEMIHTFTLIHDDLPAMDNSDFRRGRPSCHKMFGEDIAILAGDALSTLAFEIIAKNVKFGKVAQVSAELSEALIKVVRGQVMDLEAEGKKISLKHLQNIHLLKTAALIETSARIGAVIANAREREIKALQDYARHLGLAFQIADDILDVESSSAVAGKPVKADAKLNKATYPAILGLPKAKLLAEKQVKASIDCLSVFRDRAPVLRTIAESAIRRMK